MTASNFHSLQLNPIIQQVVKNLHFQEPTRIQLEAIPAILAGRSLVGQSKTGSGKTHAYLLPIFNNIKDDCKRVQFVITAPTRELCRQIYREIRQIIELSGNQDRWFAKLLIGGVEKQISVTAETLPQIIVGTPRRILSLINDGVLSIYSAESFVIDEADLMAELGFLEEIDQLLVRSKEDIQVIAFSATIPENLKHFFQKYLKQPLYVQGEEGVFPKTLEHRLIALKNRNPADLIIQLSKVFHPYLALVFANGKEKTDKISQALQNNGLNVGYIHGGLSPRERRRMIRAINNLRYQYVVATDLASRGIDIEGVSHVINAELPKEEHFYIHRVGRTARAGLPGTAISFYDEGDLSLIESFERKNVNFKYVDIKNGEWVESQKLKRTTNQRRTYRRKR